MAWEVWKDRLPRGLDLRILPPGSEEADALRFWRFFWTAYEAPATQYPWEDIFKQIWTTPRRLDIAIWSGPILCGFAAGMASKGNNVTLKFIERWPGPVNPLRGYIAAIAVDIACMYAKLLGKQWVMIKDPIPAAIPRYKDLRFTFDRNLKRHTYWRRIVE
jgi:hypothetical protein